MGASPNFDLDGGVQSLASVATPVHVYRYNPDATGSEPKIAAMPNVQCEQIDERDGGEPATAQFSYMLDNTLAATAGWPCEFEDLWPMQGRESAYRVNQDDRIVVVAALPDRTRRLLFDGFVTSPQADVSPDSQQVTFSATAVPVRCWDSPVGGRWQRDGDDPQKGDVHATGLPTRFNPDGKPNCTPKNADVADGDYSDFPHPVFVETQGSPDASGNQAYWTLATAAKYLLARYNDQTYVENPDFSVMDMLLNNRAPKDGEFFDPDDASTYDENPLTLGDYDCDNRPWPDVLGELLGYYGFGMRWVSELDREGLPSHVLEIYRRDQEGPTDPKDLRLPRTGAKVTDGPIDVGAFHVAHDFKGVANEIDVETAPRLYGISVVLAPMFQPQPGDETVQNAARFRRATVADGTNPSDGMYRLYGVDELGEGHWSIKNRTWLTGQPMDFTSLFAGDLDAENNPRAWVKRYRPALKTLFNANLNATVKAILQISRTYNGPDAPCLWDGSNNGDWQTIAGSWELTEDRLGVRITADDLLAWKIGVGASGSPQVFGPVLNAIAPLSVPNARPDVDAYKPFHLMLTAMIEGDHGVLASAPKRKASPISFSIQRRIDARDHYRWHGYYQHCQFNTPPDGMIYNVVFNDEQAAKERASQLRTVHEFPPIAGSVTVPRLDFSLAIADRIKSINGRNVSLQTNAGVEAGEAPAYPFVVARTYNLAGEQQSTVYQLSDRRLEPAPIHKGG